MPRSRISAVKSTLAVSGVLLAALIGLSGCGDDATATVQAPAPQVSVASALEREVTEWDEFTGRVEAVESVEIRPRVTGYIESVNFSEGSTVRKGDLLFVIDPRPRLPTQRVANRSSTSKQSRVKSTTRV
jgi:multidrug efflux pump subunit AcrA (membrane-fusion protein)